MLASLDLVAALEAVPLPGWLCDQRGRIIHANDRWLAYLGGEAQLRRHWLIDRFLHAHDIAAVRAAWHSALATGDGFEVKGRLRRFDGTWRWHVLTAVPVGGRRDSAPAWLGTWTDVDDPVRELEALRYRSRMLEAQGEASLDATMLVDPDCTLVWANRRACELWGISPEDLGRPGADQRITTSLEAQYHDPERILRDELELVDGRTIERYSTPVIDDAGSYIGRMNTYRDITGTRRTMEALHDRARASFVLSYVADAVILVDTDEVVHLWNPAAEQLTGIRASDAIDRRLGDLLIDWTVTRELVPVLESVDEPRTAATVPLELAGGREVWVSAVGVRCDDGVVFALRDVSDDQRLDRMRSDIVATVSHELRTPLTSIYGMAITLQDAEPRLEDETRHRLLATIVEQSARLGSILDDILVANGLEGGSVTVRPRFVDVRDIVRLAIETVSVKVPPPTPIAVEFDPELPPVSADAARTQQALVNLLENAVKYSPEGGPIHVRVRRANSSDIAIEITDHGLGIPTDELEHVFDKFHRLDPSMTLGIAGTGLGLYIARELARRMRGDVTVHSVEGAGSTFTLFLPAV